jgi:hypothetical protein
MITTLFIFAVLFLINDITLLLRREYNTIVLSIPNFIIALLLLILT